jgi:pyruvate dehydrogenase E2 component (dihydrolipoamide acetyltransferase)
MPKPILMPQVGQDIETARIVEWYVKEGDRVKTGDLVAAVESDKATFELESFDDGIVLQLLFSPGQEAKVLEPIAFIGEARDKPHEVANSTHQETKPKPKPVPPTAKNHGMDRFKPEQGAKIYISPAARRAAKIHQINIASVKGSGPNGRIIKRDILRYVPVMEPPGSAELMAKEIPLSKMRKQIADRMVYSKQTVPHFYLSCDINMSNALAWRTKYNTEKDQKISVNDLLLAATAAALKKYPKLNAHVQEGRILLQERINIGVAVSSEEGLLVPVLEDVDKKSLEQISLESAQIVAKARGGRIKAAAPATFTISNLGMYGISHFLPIINPPESAILGVGKIEKKLIPYGDDGIKICSMMNLSLVCDHRAVDGTYGAQFLAELKHVLEEVLFTEKK